MRPDVTHAVALGEDDLVVVHDGDGDARNARALHLGGDQPVDLGQAASTCSRVTRATVPTPSVPLGDSEVSVAFVAFVDDVVSAAVSVGAASVAVGSVVDGLEAASSSSELHATISIVNAPRARRPVLRRP